MKQRKAKGEDAENTKTTDTPNRELYFFFFFFNRELSKQRESHVQNYYNSHGMCLGNY